MPGHHEMGQLLEHRPGLGTHDADSQRAENTVYAAEYAVLLCNTLQAWLWDCCKVRVCTTKVLEHVRVL